MPDKTVKAILIIDGEKVEITVKMTAVKPSESKLAIGKGIGAAELIKLCKKIGNTYLTSEDDE